MGTGTAMAHKRAAVLAGARRAVIRDGTRVHMTQIAAEAGVAKATLYNHFRTREAVLAALLDAEVDALLTRFADRPLAAALAGTAQALSEHPVLRAVERYDPGLLATLARVDPNHAAWRRAADAVAELLAGFDRQGTRTVLRWLASFVLSPADPADPAAIARDVDVLLTGLPSRLGSRESDLTAGTGYLRMA